jgi:catechol 2,3-dioxygenase-like lactoylglutathione lyase family enzyme
LDPRLSLVTLGVKNLETSLKFYRDGLGLPTSWTPDKGVIFFRTSGTILALYPLEKLSNEVGNRHELPCGDFNGITLAHNVKQKEEVDQILSRAEAAGAKIEKRGHDAFWGGYTGYFSDPDGYFWEISWGAFPFRPDGSLDVS